MAEGSLTSGAFIRHGTSVNKFVTDQETFLLKGFVTLRAFVGLFTSVLTYVDDETAVVREDLAAEGTLMYHFLFASLSLCVVDSCRRVRSQAHIWKIL